ncbi:unnamed protein product [Closterium sp. NIES-64]|nr:unnamed protein product [Closterium sp. NIES-64]
MGSGRGVGGASAGAPATAVGGNPAAVGSGARGSPAVVNGSSAAGPSHSGAGGGGGGGGVGDGGGGSARDGSHGSHGSSHSQGSSSQSKWQDQLSRMTNMIFVASQGDVDELTRLLDEGADVNSADYDGRSAIHLAACEGHLGVLKLLLARGARVNPRDRWGHTPLTDARKAMREGKKGQFPEIIQVLLKHGGIEGVSGEEWWGVMESGGEWKRMGAEADDWEIDPSELDFSKSKLIGKGAFGEIRRVMWRGTPVAAKTILPGLSDDVQITKEFRDEMFLLPKLRHPNIVQFLGCVTRRPPLCLVTEYLPGGDLHDVLKAKGALPPRIAVGYGLDIASEGRPAAQNSSGIRAGYCQVREGVIAEGLMGGEYGVPCRSPRIAVGYGLDIARGMNELPALHNHKLESIVLFAPLSATTPPVPLPHSSHPQPFHQGMNYLHNHKPESIIHRDLKPRNLIRDEGDHLKVADFGLSKLVKVNALHEMYKMTGETGSCSTKLGLSKLVKVSALHEMYKVTGETGSYRYMMPEVFKHQAYDCTECSSYSPRSPFSVPFLSSLPTALHLPPDRYMAPEVFKHQAYDRTVDVYSFSVIFYEMFEGLPPFAKTMTPEGVAWKVAMEGIRPPFKSKAYPEGVKDLVSRCWAADPMARPSFMEVIEVLEGVEKALLLQAQTNKPALSPFSA